ncbi:MAG: HdeD family acid-resistance protein [Candidatus Angelobacter sp.]
MIRLMIQNWWLLFLRGVLAIAFAIFIFAFMPFLPAPFLRQFAFAGLAAIFALFAFATGVLTIAAAVRGAGQGGSSWLMLADGIAVATGGLIILLAPGSTLVRVIQLIALIALVVGVLEFVAGIHLRRHVTDEWLLISGGIISIAFAPCLLLANIGTVQAAMTWVSVYALATGLAVIGLALRLRSLRNSIHALAGSKPAARAAAQTN